MNGQKEEQEEGWKEGNYINVADVAGIPRILSSSSSSPVFYISCSLSSEKSQGHEYEYLSQISGAGAR